MLPSYQHSSVETMFILPTEIAGRSIQRPAKKPITRHTLTMLLRRHVCDADKVTETSQ